MTWRDVNDVLRYWEKHPPVQIMVQGYLGIGTSKWDGWENLPIEGEKVDFKNMTDEEFAKLLSKREVHI